MKSLYVLNKVILLSVLSILCTGQANAYTQAEVKQAIVKQSVEMGVDPAIMLSIAKTESGFRQEAKGYSGTVGVFQLLPATAKKMGLNPYDLQDNIKGGITYYKNMYKSFGSMELAVAAYNTGPDRIKRNNNQVPQSAKPFVSRIMKDYNYYKSQNL